MRRFSILEWKILFFLFLTVSACTKGQVVRVTTVQDTREGLREEDVQKLKELKKGRDNQDIGDSLNHVIYKTPHFTAFSYLQQYPQASGRNGYDYKVGGYDVLKIIVYEENDLSRDAVRVSGDGYISFPLIGRTLVNNMTTSELEELISNKLSLGQYLLNPHVSVMVTDYNSKRFLVLGAVKNSGSFPLQAQERVLDAISKAGGIVFDQSGKRGMIIRVKNPEVGHKEKIVIDLDLQKLLKEGDQVSNLFMMDKDVLFIPSGERFYIIGQIHNPGSYRLSERDITLVEAISMAGGFTQIAARNRTRIIRVDDGIEKIIMVRVDAITNAGKKIQDVQIQPDDVIVVPSSFF